MMVSVSATFTLVSRLGAHLEGDICISAKLAKSIIRVLTHFLQSSNPSLPNTYDPHINGRVANLSCRSSCSVSSSLALYTNRMASATSPRRPAACAIAVNAPYANALTGAVLCAISLAVDASPLQIQMPKVSLPSLPKISLPSLPSLPKFGGKEEKKEEAPPPRQRPTGNVRVRASGAMQAPSDAPTLSDVTGSAPEVTIGPGEGWKRFPSRRMPGANMDGWKEIVKDITPNV